MLHSDLGSAWVHLPDDLRSHGAHVVACASQPWSIVCPKGDPLNSQVRQKPVTRICVGPSVSLFPSLLPCDHSRLAHSPVLGVCLLSLSLSLPPSLPPSLLRTPGIFQMHSHIPCKMEAALFLPARVSPGSVSPHCSGRLGRRAVLRVVAGDVLGSDPGAKHSVLGA